MPPLKNEMVRCINVMSLLHYQSHNIVRLNTHNIVRLNTHNIVRLNIFKYSSVIFMLEALFIEMKEQINPECV